MRLAKLLWQGVPLARVSPPGGNQAQCQWGRAPTPPIEAGSRFKKRLIGMNGERGSLGGAPPDDLLVRLRGRRSVRGNGGWARAPAFVAGFGQTAWLMRR